MEDLAKHRLTIQMGNEKTYKGQSYDYDYMMEKVRLHKPLKEEVEEAKAGVVSAESNLEEAREHLEDLNLTWHNHISEWEGFKPFEDELKKTSEKSEKTKQ